MKHSVTTLVLAFVFLTLGVNYSTCFAQQNSCTVNPAGSQNNERPIDRSCDPGQRVSMTNGCFHFSTTDLSLPGPFPMILTRYYDSSMEYGGPMGNNFEFSFNRRLLQDGFTVYYYTGKGYRVPVLFLAGAPGGQPFIAIRDHYKLSSNEYGGTTVEDKFGNRDFMNAAGFIVKSLDRNNNELDFNRDDENILLSVVDPLHSRSITFSHDPTTNLITSATDSTGRTVTYTYANTVTEVFVTAANPTITLNPWGIVKVTHPAVAAFPLGTTEQYGYDVYGRMTSETDGNGNNVLTNTYAPFAFTNLAPLPTNYSIATQTVNGNTSTYAYTLVDSSGGQITPYFSILSTSITDAKGNNTTSINDAFGNVEKITISHPGLPSYSTLYQYSPFVYNKIKQTDPDGSGTSWTYDDLSNITSMTKFSASDAVVDGSKGTQALTATTSYTYESRFNQVLTTTDPNGNVTTNDYGDATSNPSGNLLSTTYPTTAAGTAVESFTYNSIGEILTDTAPDGTVTQNTYDGATGFLTQKVQDYGTGKLNATTQYTYDIYGHIATATDPNGHTTTTTTNAMDQVTEIDGPSGEVEQKTYDGDGRVLIDQKKISGSQWEKTENVYNQYDQLIATRQYTDGTNYLETDYGYDADANRTTVTDPLGHTVTTAYDERNKAYLITDALGHSVQYDFDGEENIVKLTDELGHVTTYAFDGLNRMEQKTFPDGSYQTWKYDAAGNITGMRTTAGNIISQTYDARNRMLTQNYGSLITDTYDIMGRLLTSTEGGTSLIYAYDDLGRNTSFTDQAGLTSTYSYDLQGNRTSEAYPTGVTVNRAYDASNRLSTLKDGSGNTQATYSYDLLGQETGATLANGTSVSHGYDLLSRLSSLDNTLNGSTRNYSYVYNAASQRTSDTEPRGTVTYTYSNRNELTGITEPSGSPFGNQSFVYDAGYNRASWTNQPGLTISSTTEDYTVNNLNQYTAITGDTTPTWNSDGGLATYQGNTYSYDALHRLTEVDNGVDKYLFSYDPTGRRVKKVVENSSGTVLSTYSYHYDGSEVAVEYRPSSVTWTYYLGVGTDEPVMRINGTTKQWYYRDGQGSISTVADNSGNALETYEYDAQGRFRIQKQGIVEIETTIGNDILYCGYRCDPETGNYFCNARYYSPILGRFISRDPLSGAEFSQGTNLYAYCENDYPNRNDPTGESWMGAVTGALDAGSLIPGVQDLVDPVNAAISFATGDYQGAALSIAGMVPAFGEAADVARVARDAERAAGEAGKITKEAGEAEKTYQTYTKTNKDTGEVYTGRTSGRGTPEENVAARDKNHHMNDKGFGPAELDKSSSNSDAIRGREQQMIDANGGAKSGGGTSGNAIRGVSPTNEKINDYNKAANQEFGSS